MFNVWKWITCHQITMESLQLHRTPSCWEHPKSEIKYKIDKILN